MSQIFCPACHAYGTHAPGCPDIPDTRICTCYECREPIHSGETHIQFENVRLHPDCYAAMLSSDIMAMLGGKVVNG